MLITALIGILASRQACGRAVTNVMDQVAPAPPVVDAGGTDGRLLH